MPARVGRWARGRAAARAKCRVAAAAAISACAGRRTPAGLAGPAQWLRVWRPKNRSVRWRLQARSRSCTCRTMRLSYPQRRRRNPCTPLQGLAIPPGSSETAATVARPVGCTTDSILRRATQSGIHKLPKRPPLPFSGRLAGWSFYHWISHGLTSRVRPHIGRPARISGLRCLRTQESGTTSSSLLDRPGDTAYS